MTLSARLKLLFKEQPDKSQAGLARATGAKPPSVSDWVSGLTKSMNSEYLSRAASYFNVNSNWLSLGAGPKRNESTSTAPMPKAADAGEPVAQAETTNIAGLTGSATELALLFDMIPSADRVRRALAYNAASKAILDVLEPPKSSG